MASRAIEVWEGGAKMTQERSILVAETVEQFLYEPIYAPSRKRGEAVEVKGGIVTVRRPDGEVELAMPLETWCDLVGV